MSISLQAPTHLLPIPGIRIAATAAGIRYKNRDDLVLFEICDTANTAAVLTKNQFCAAPIIVVREHLSNGQAKYLLINSGNANAGTGKLGITDTKQICREFASRAKCSATEILPFSTGVIGERLPLGKVTKKITTLLEDLKNDAWLSAAQAIMTTDTVAKGHSEQLNLNDKMITITGIAKGAGMICPDMATMLAFFATDLSIDNEELKQLLGQAVTQSFHCITVDGDTSTNDACVLIATGESGICYKDLDEQSKKQFVSTLNGIFIKLAQAIIRDGEGVTKFITVKIEQAKNTATAREVAFTIAHSPLVKTAAFASDPNWGRILAAAGRACVGNLNIEKLSLFINELSVFSNGELVENYSDENGQKEMQKEEIQFKLQLGQGEAGATVWTTDLSHEYVTINAEYRS